MSNLIIIKALMFLQAMALGIVYLEHEAIEKIAKENKLKTLLGRIFILAIPTLTIISLLIRPLES